MKYDPKAKLTTNFTHREVIKSSTAIRLEIDNTPCTHIMDNAYELATNVLEPIRKHFKKGFAPNSWYRGEELEREITKKGFAKWCKKRSLDVSLESSWDTYFARKSHPNGQAADIEIIGVDNDDLYEWIRDNLEFDQLIREFKRDGDPMSGWVHVSWRGIDNRKEVFSIS